MMKILVRDDDEEDDDDDNEDADEEEEEEEDEEVDEEEVDVPLQAAPLRVEPVQRSVEVLHAATWEWDGSQLAQLLQEQPDFTVIGAIGMQGSGKSSLLSALAALTATPDAFAVQGEEHVRKAVHCSRGVRATVTAQRLILLDTQPVLSASVLAESLGRDSVGSLAAYHFRALQLVSFMLSVCHVVVVQSDAAPASRGHLWELVAAAEPLPGMFSARGIASEPAECVFVVNRVPPDELTCAGVRNIARELKRSLPRLAERQESESEPHDQLSARGFISNPELVPRFSADFPNLYCVGDVRGGDPDWGELSEMLLALPKITPLPHGKKPLTERDWLTKAGRCWERLSSGSMPKEYETGIAKQDAMHSMYRSAPRRRT